jgi:aldehyde:ferredoxin oxidoreductase
MKGYTGKILFVDLSTGLIVDEPIPDEVYESLLSGVGLGCYVLHKNIPKGADPLGPDNVLGFVSGLLTGTGSVMTGRWMAVAKSPLTGGWGDANCGGTFSPAIKRCGYDGIFIRGISDKPVYLYVDSHKAELRNATHVWGKDAVEAENILEEECAKKRGKPKIAVIGTSGEKQSLISGICNDRGRIAARSGLGAVMGSKKLKAVVLAGNGRITCENPELMRTISKEFTDKVKNMTIPGFLSGRLLEILARVQSRMTRVAVPDGIMAAGILKKWGTGFNNVMGVVNGDTPIKNWNGSRLDFGKSRYRNLAPDRLKQREFKKYSCYSCVVGCGGISRIDDIREGAFRETHTPEYETVSAFGSLLLNGDSESILYINELLNRAGMDSISAGHAVAFAIECFENGILTSEDTGGLQLAWGNTEAIVKLLKQMINREGLGDLLADGVKVASEKIGNGSQNYALHVGGQEPGLHDSRFDPMMGVHYCADPTPGKHTVGCFQYYNYVQLWNEVSWAPKISLYPKYEEYIASSENATKSVAISCYKQVIDGIGGCLFAMTMGVHNWNPFKMLNAATNWHKTADEYLEIGMRIQTLKQLFNIREGIDPRNNQAHPRMAGNPPLEYGPLKGKSVPIHEMVALYWEQMGWHGETGRPTSETVEKLSLTGFVA